MSEALYSLKLVHTYMSLEEENRKKSKTEMDSNNKIDRGDVASGATGIPNIEQKANKKQK
jgi:hypothetical protein